MRKIFIIIIAVILTSCNREYWREYKQVILDNPQARYERLSKYLDSVEQKKLCSEQLNKY